MTNEVLEKLIDVMNSKPKEDLIFSTNLSDSVTYSKVWHKEPRGGIANECSYDHYFVKNREGEFVGVVFDMQDDLHIFVKPKFRRKGFITNAVKNTIFPWLFQQGRTKQTVTFREEEMATYCSKNWGFKVTDESSEIEIMKEYSRVIEEQIYKDPSQWLMFREFWKE